MRLCELSHAHKQDKHYIWMHFSGKQLAKLSPTVQILQTVPFLKHFSPTVVNMMVSENLCIPLIQPSASLVLFWEVHMGLCSGTVSLSSLDHSNVLPWMMLLQAFGTWLLNKRWFYSPKAFRQQMRMFSSVSLLSYIQPGGDSHWSSKKDSKKL